MWSDRANRRNTLSVDSIVRKAATADILANDPTLIAEHRGEIPDQHPLQRDPVWFEAARKHVVPEVVPIGYRRVGLQEALNQIAGFPNIESCLASVASRK